MTITKMNDSLKNTLRLNALSCLGFGLTFALIPQPIAEFLDGIAPSIIRFVGIGLALNGIHLVIASLRRGGIGRVELGYFILGDVLWVLASFVLIAFIPHVVNSPLAIVSTLAVATLVGSFALLQARWGWDILQLNHS